MKLYFFVYLVFPFLAFAQIVPQVNIPINISDGVLTKTLFFGLDSIATNGIDRQLGEEEQPPLPPTGVFDARFIGTDINIPEIGEGLLKDYRPGSDTTKGQRIHELRYQVGTGNIITISWNLPNGVTGNLQDFFGGIVINSNMNGSGSVTVSNPGIINKLKMTINYNLFGNLLPSPPNLISPLNGSSNQPINLTLSWTIVSGAIQYHLQIAKDTNFNSIVYNDSSIQTNSKQVQLSNKTKYYWRVRAKNNAGWGSFSETWNFLTIVDVPKAPVLNSPPKGAVSISTSPTLIWYSVEDAENYLVEVSIDSIFNNIVFSNSTSDTFIQLQGLLYATEYFWKVTAKNLAGSGPSSEVWNFITYTTGVENLVLEFQKEFFVSSNFPNPFNSSTKFVINLPEESFVHYKLFNLNGELLYESIKEFKQAKTNELKINLNSLNNKNYSSGIYFLEIVVQPINGTPSQIIRKINYIK